VLVSLGEAAGNALTIGASFAANAAAITVNPVGTAAAAIKRSQGDCQEQ